MSKKEICFSKNHDSRITIEHLKYRQIFKPGTDWDQVIEKATFMCTVLFAWLYNMEWHIPLINTIKFNWVAVKRSSAEKTALTIQESGSTVFSYVHT